MGAQAVINLTGILFQKGQTFEDVQADGAAHIAEAAGAAGVGALVHVSAIGADLEADAEYAVTKAEGETAVREAFPNAVILRPSIIFGPEDGFFNKFAGMARFLPALPLVGGGHTRFQPVFVGDVAQAIVAALSNRTAAPMSWADRHLFLQGIAAADPARDRPQADSGAPALRHRQAEGGLPAASAQSAS